MKKEILMKRFPNVRFFGDAVIKDSVTIGNGTGIGEYVVIGANAKIGKKCIILYHVTISKDAVIGDGVFIGPNTSFFNDKFPPSKVSCPPIVKDGVIIGGHVSILPSVVVGEKSVIAAGSVVTRDIPDGEVWKGNPAKFYMSREEYDLRKRMWEANG